MVVTTYWRVLRPVSRPLTVALLVTLPSGIVLDVSDSVTQDWLPPIAWTPGSVVRVQTWPLYLGPLTHGTIVVSAQVRAGSPATRPAPDVALAPAPAASGSGRMAAPHLTARGTAVLLADIPVR